MALSPILAIRASERTLLRLALDLGADAWGGPPTEPERHLRELALAEPATPTDEIAHARTLIRLGGDPLGEQLLVARSGVERRALGAFYTPPAIVAAMLDWTLAGDPGRLVDAGCGSGRFIAEAARRRPGLELVPIDLDPLATLLTRAALAVLGAPATVIQSDYLTLDLPEFDGRTAFIGNPPYVRHHDLTGATKAWAARTAARLGYRVSGLAGLHALFMLATAVHARPGDLGCYVVSSEWLDVGYGALVRDQLLNGLGGRALDAIDPRAVPFEAMTTAVIVSFEVGSHPDAMRLRLVGAPDELGALGEGHLVARAELLANTRWSPLMRREAGNARTGTVRLGDIARVSRGVATGANSYFLLSSEQAHELGIEAWCRPAITAAAEVIAAGPVIRATPGRKLLLDLPADLDRSSEPALNRYLRRGERRHGESPAVAKGYLASHRMPWWRVGRHNPPPIVATYMARRAPVFARNADRMAIANVVHGIYPRRPMDDRQLDALVAHLNAAAQSYRGQGRTYHGGLEKFEPREMENLSISATGQWLDQA